MTSQRNSSTVNRGARLARRARVWLCTALLSVCWGCHVGPDFEHPLTSLPHVWRDQEEADLLTADDCEELWWSEFQDPTLDWLIQEAVAENPGLREAFFRVLEARAQRGIVTGQRLPDVTQTAEYSFKKVSGNSSPFPLNSPDSFHLFSLGFDAAWELDLWGKYRRAIEAADAEVGVAAHDYQALLVTLLGDVAAAYVDLRMYQERIAVANRNVKIQKHSLQLTQERQRVGLTRPLDVTQALSSLHATIATIPQLEFGTQRAENRLCVLLGEAPRDLSEQLHATQGIPKAPRVLNVGVPADLLRRRPDVQAMELKLLAETARIGVAIADLYPQLSLTGTVSVDSIDLVDLFDAQSLVHTVGPSLRWNFLNFGRLRNTIRRQEAIFEQVGWQYQSTVLAAAEEVENGLTSYTQEQRRSESLGKAVAAAQESVRLSLLNYEQGLVSFLNVLDAQRTLLGLEDQYVVSRAKLALNRIALYKALGGGWQAFQTDDCRNRLIGGQEEDTDSSSPGPSRHSAEEIRSPAPPQAGL